MCGESAQERGAVGYAADGVKGLDVGVNLDVDAKVRMKDSASRRYMCRCWQILHNTVQSKGRMGVGSGLGNSVVSGLCAKVRQWRQI